jgi:hypothetical protein
VKSPPDTERSAQLRAREEPVLALFVLTSRELGLVLSLA